MEFDYGERVRTDKRRLDLEEKEKLGDAQFNQGELIYVLNHRRRDEYPNHPLVRTARACYSSRPSVGVRLPSRVVTQIDRLISD